LAVVVAVVEVQRLLVAVAVEEGRAMVLWGADEQPQVDGEVEVDVEVEVEDRGAGGFPFCGKGVSRRGRVKK
jgi:hypothetical protein